MSPEDMNALVRLAGLEKAREKFPEDVADAAAVAAAIRAALPPLPGPGRDRAGEPWPAPFAGPAPSEEDGA